MTFLIARLRPVWTRLRRGIQTLFASRPHERLAVVCPRCGERFIAPAPRDIDVLRERDAWDVVAWIDEQEQAAVVRLVADCPHHRTRFHASALTWRRVTA